MNIKKITVGNWVTSQSKVGKIVSEGEKGEFWVLWSGDSLPMNESAKSLQIVDYEGEDLAGKTFKDGRCNRLVYEYAVKAEVYLEHKKKPQIWSLEKLNQELESEKQPLFDKPTTLSLSQIRRDGGTQSRATIDPTTVDEYAEDYKNGANFPPITVFYDGQFYWLVDGFHREKAALKAGLKKIAAIVKQGTRRDAVLYSVGVNATHGLRRTNADKRRAVMRLLEDEEWSGWSNREIARRCSVSKHLVNTLRNKMSLALNSSENNQQDVTENNSSKQTERTYITKHGTQARMNTANIGKGKATDSFPSSSAEDQEVTSPSSEENNQPSDAPLNIREIFSVGDLAKIKEGNHEFSGQSGTITFIPDRHCAVVEFAPGKRKLIQLEDFELPPPKQSKENSLTVGDQVKIKEGHYFGGQSGIITSFPNRDSVIVEFSPGKRELINLKDLDLQQLRQPHPPKKKEIIIQEGLNYKAGCPGYGCKWYVEVSEENYKRLKEYREKVGTITLDGAIGRFLSSSEEKEKIPNSDDLVIYFLSNVQQLPRERVNLVLEAFAKAHYDAFVQVFKVIEQKGGAQ